MFPCSVFNERGYFVTTAIYGRKFLIKLAAGVNVTNIFKVVINVHA
jgi:hypothetical protein